MLSSPLHSSPSSSHRSLSPRTVLLSLLVLFLSFSPLSAQQVTPLNSTEYVWDQLGSYSYNNYSIYMDPANATSPVRELRLSLTSFRGDAELFVSTSSLPTAYSYTWRGYDAGTAALVIGSWDSNFCTDCTYYISVYAHEFNATYNLVAALHGNHSHIRAYRNTPVNAISPRGDWQGFYYFPRNYERYHGLRIHTSPSYGAAVVYVNVGNMSSDFRTSYPTPDSYTWMSYSSFSGTYLAIHHEDPNWCFQSNPDDQQPDTLTGCVFFISVYQLFGHSTQYTLLVTQASLDTFDPTDPYEDQHISLVNHVPLIRYVAANDANYSHEFFYAERVTAGSEFQVSLTPISGMCSMAVSTDSQMRYPQPWDNVWTSDKSGTFTFSDTQGASRYGAGVFIGVWAEPGLNCTYTIVFNVYPNSRIGRFPQRLTDGLPQFDTLRDDDEAAARYPGLTNWRYYVFYLPQSDGVFINIDKFMGDVEVYISGTPWAWNNSYVDFNPPNATSFDFGLYDHGLTAYHFREAPPGRYEIGVHARYRADYAITVTAQYTDQVLIEGVPTTGYIRPHFNISDKTDGPDGSWQGYVAQYVFVLVDANLSSVSNAVLNNTGVPLVLSLTQLSGHVDVFVSDTYSPWFIHWNDSTTYNWSAQATRLDSIVIPSNVLRPGPYWVKVYAWENSTYSITAGYANFNGLQVGLPQNAWMPPHVSQYYMLTVPGGEHAHDVIVTLLPLVGRAKMVFGWVDPNPNNFVLPDHRNSSTYFPYSTGDYNTNVVHAMRIPNYFCELKRCTYIIEVWSGSEGARYNLMTMSYNTTDSNNQSSVIQHTVPQPAMTGSGEGSWDTPAMSHYTFHVPLENSYVSLAVSLLGSTLGSYQTMSVGLCHYPPTPDHGEWRRDNLVNNPVVLITPDDMAFTQPNNTCGRSTQAGVYYVTVFHYGYEDAIYTMALAVRSNISRYTNESSVILVPTLRQVGVAPPPYYEFFRMFQNLPSEQIEIGLSAGTILYHSTDLVYPNATNTPDIKDSRLDDAWLEWPLQNTTHYFGVQNYNPRGWFSLTPNVRDGNNDTTHVEYLDFGASKSGRAYQGQVTNYQFQVTWDDYDWMNPNASYVEITMEVLTGNPHLWLNQAPYSNSSNGPDSTTLWWPSWSSNMWNITDPNFPVLRLDQPPTGWYFLSIQPALLSNASAEWRITVKRNYDAVTLLSSEPRQDYMYHNTSNWYRIPMNLGPEAGYSELRLSMTSWYGDAEVFVAPYQPPYSPYGDYVWRTYDAGTTALVINSTDPNWCWNCDYFVLVWSNEVASYFSLVATLYQNYSSIPLTNHLPINMRTPINSAQRYHYQPKNYELQHGFRVHVTPAYGAAVFAVNVIDELAYVGQEWPYPNATSGATWWSTGMFEGGWIHIKHTDDAFCRLAGRGSGDERSRCIYLITVWEASGMADAAYTLLLQSVQPPDVLPILAPGLYDPVREPHNRLPNHIAVLQYGEATNITYFKAFIVNSGSLFRFSLTVLSGWADMYVDPYMRYPNTSAIFNSALRNTSSYSFIVDDTISFTEVFIAVECHVNSTFTITADEFSGNRLGRFPQLLTNGIPHYDSLAAVRPDDPTHENGQHWWRYYVYYLPVNDDITISINKFMGEVEAYIAFQPLLDPNVPEYTQFPIPGSWDPLSYDASIWHHGLNTLPVNNAMPGRYLIGVHAHRLADYAISVTAHFTHQVLLTDIPQAGQIWPYVAGVNDTRNVARYIVEVVTQPDRNMSIILTTLSGLAHLYVSTQPWIDPWNTSSYQWAARDHPYQIDIAPSDLPLGYLYIEVWAHQNTTYSLLATEFGFTGLQLGLPITVGVPKEVTEHVYAITIPGAERAHDLFVTVLPIVGRAHLFGTNITAGFRYTNHSDPSTFDFVAAYPYTKPQTLYIPNYWCPQERCTYLIEVHCPVSPCFYTLNAYPWNTSAVSDTTLLIEQHVPQFGYIPRLWPGSGDVPQSHYMFHIPETNSTAVLAFTRQDSYGPGGLQDIMICVDHVRFPTKCEDRSDARWILNFGDFPAFVLSGGPAGAYFVTVANHRAFEDVAFTFALRIMDSTYADNKGIVLVDTVAQVGVSVPEENWMTYYRLYHFNLSHQVHVKMSPKLELFHSSNASNPYPSPWYNNYDDRLSSAVELEWIEYPAAQQHFFGAWTSANNGQFWLYPYILDGQNATNVRQTLEYGVSREARLLGNTTIYYNVFVPQWWIDNGVNYMQVKIEALYGAPVVFVQQGSWVNDTYGWRTNTTFPWIDNQIANITSTDFPFTWLYPVQAGEYLIAVHAYHESPASFRITVVPGGGNYTSGFWGAIQYLEPAVITSGSLLNNSFDTYRIEVPREWRDNGTRLGRIMDFKVTLTSWYGEAEFFVNYAVDDFSQFDWEHGWRSYDAGTSSVIVMDRGDDPHGRGEYCRDDQPTCVFFIVVWSNEVESYYDLQHSVAWPLEMAYTPAFTRLTNRQPHNSILAGDYRPGSNPNHTHARRAVDVNAPQPPPPDHPPQRTDVALFSFIPSNYQLQHGIRIHTYPAYGGAPFYVTVVHTDEFIAGGVPFMPRPDRPMWWSDGLFEGSWLHIAPTDMGFCNSQARNWTGPFGPSDCVYLIGVYSVTEFDSQFTILVNTVTPEELRPEPNQPDTQVGQPGFTLREPHVRLLNNVPLAQYQPNGTWNYYKVWTNQPNVEMVVTLTTISGWADFYVDDMQPFPNATYPGYNFFDSNRLNESTLQFFVNATYSWTELFIGVRAWTNVTYTITMSQYPIIRLGRFPLRLTNGVPQVDTLGERDRGEIPYFLSEWRYFVYYLPNDDSVTVQLSRFMGEVGVYMLHQPWDFRRPYDQNWTEFALPPYATNLTLTNHGLDVWTWQYAPAGRYVIAVHAEGPRNATSRLVDYSITVNRAHTHAILLKDVPTTGYIRPFIHSERQYGNGSYHNSSRYSLEMTTVWDRDLVISATELSGHVNVYVSTYWWLDPENATTYQWSATWDSVRLQPVVIPQSQLQQTVYYIHVTSNTSSTFSLLASDYYYAQIQLGLPSNAFLRAGDRQFYGLTVPGMSRAHDVIISVVPLVGQVRVSAWNVTSGWIQGNATLVPRERNNAFDVLYIDNYNCTNSRRCTYIVELYCSTYYSEYCRFDLQAIPWSTTDVANTTLILQNSVPQLGFGGSDMGTNITRTHYEFHVPQDWYSNVTITTTALYGDHYLVASKYHYPEMLFDPYFPDVPIDDFPASSTIAGPNRAIYFDWTNRVFANESASGVPAKYDSMAGTYYVTVFSWAPAGPAVYTITLDTHDNSTRGPNNNRSAIFVADGERVHGYIAPEQTHQLFAFVAPYVNTSRRMSPHAVQFDLRSDFSNFPEMYITSDGTIPSRVNNQYNVSFFSASWTLYIRPGQPGACDTTKQDCVYLISVVKPEPRPGTRRVTETSFTFLASAGEAYLPLEGGERTIGYVTPGGVQGYVVNVRAEPDRPLAQDLTVIVQPSRLFCDVTAYVEWERDPTADSPSTNYTRGVRILRLRNPQSGQYVIRVVAEPYNDGECQFTILATDQLLELQDGVPQPDVSSTSATSNTNDGIIYYHFWRYDDRPQPIYFQVDRLSSDSALNLLVKYDHDPRGPWVWSAAWNSTAEIGDAIVVSPSDPKWNNTARGFIVAVQCVKRDPNGPAAVCSYELTAANANTSRLLTDGIQLVAPMALPVGGFTYYRAWAQADPVYKTPMTITVTRLSGSVSLFVGTSPRPGPGNAIYTDSMNGRNFAVVVVPWDRLPPFGQYLYVAVRGDGPDQSTYTITAATSATFLSPGIETYGYCQPAVNGQSAIDGMFIFSLGTEPHPIVATLNYIDPPGSHVELQVRDNAMNGSEAYVWKFDEFSSRSALIERYDPNLRRCIDTRPDAGCVLFFNVTGCTNGTIYSLIAQLGDTPIDLTDDDQYQGVLYNNGTSPYRDSQRFRIGVSKPSQLGIYVEQCVGAVAGYLNFPQRGSFPDNQTHDQYAFSTTSVMQLSVGTLQPDSVYYVTIEAESPGLSRYLISANTFGNGTLPQLNQANSLICYPGENSLTFNFMPSLRTAASPVLYEVYYVEDAANNDAALYTRCGTQQEGVKMYKRWTEDEVKGITNTATGQAQFTVNETDIEPHLNSSTLYRWTILVVYANGASGFASYQPVTQRPLRPTPPSEPNRAAEDAGAIVLGVVLPITLILAGVALYLYIRNRKLRQELSVELPDVSATPSSAAARRRAQRGPDVQADSFTRGGGDMYNSLLGEDEQAGGDDSASRRKARAAQRSKATGNGSSDLPEDSDVAYRSDVI